MQIKSNSRSIFSPLSLRTPSPSMQTKKRESNFNSPLNYRLKSPILEPLKIITNPKVKRNKLKSQETEDKNKFKVSFLKFKFNFRRRKSKGSRYYPSKDNVKEFRQAQNFNFKKNSTVR